MRYKDGQQTNNNGLAILSEDISLGGGNLGEYGINSNTSANGFLKCLTRVYKKKGGKADIQPEKSKSFMRQNEHAVNQAIGNINNLIKDSQVKQKARAQSLVPVRKNHPNTIKV